MSSSLTLEEMAEAIEKNRQLEQEQKPKPQKPMVRKRGRKIQVKHPQPTNKVNPQLAQIAAKSNSFCLLVDAYGIDRVAKMRGMSRRQVQRKYIHERDGVERQPKPRKPKPNRGNK